MLAVAALLFHLMIPVQAEGATISGVVRDETTGEAVTGANVVLPDLRHGTSTDGEGRYFLSQVPIGPQRLVIQRVGYASRTLDVIVPPVGVVVNVSLRAVAVELRGLEVRPRVPVRDDDETDALPSPDVSVSAAALRNHPLLAEADALEALVGAEVVTTPEIPTGMHVRGGAADQVAFLLDGIPVLNPYHATGSFSAWNPDAIDRVTLWSMPPLVAGPSALSGVVEVRTKTPMGTPQLVGAASTTQARLTLAGELPMSRTAVLLSGRRVGWLQGWRADDRASLQQGDDWLASVARPLFGGQLRLLRYENRNQVRAVAAGQSADRQTPAESLSPGTNRFGWRSRSTGLTWTDTLGGGIGFRLSGWVADGHATATWAATDTMVERLTTRRTDSGALVEALWPAWNGRTVVGLRVDRSRTSYQVGRSRSDVRPTYSLAGAAPAWTGSAAHVRPLSRRTWVDVGLRSTWFADRAYVAPRVFGYWKPSDSLTVSLGFARTFQFEQSLRNPESPLKFSFPIDLFVGAAAPGVPVARSDQVSASVKIRPAPGVRLRTVAYTRGFEGLVLVGPLTGAPFAVDGFTLGSGTARGAAVELSASRSRSALLSSYGTERVHLTYGDTSYVPSSASSHYLQAGALVFPVATVSLRGGFTAVWDRRTTAAVGPFDWGSCTSPIRGCDFAGSPGSRAEPLGASRLPAYVRLDLGARGQWHLHLGNRDLTFGSYVEATGILGRAGASAISQDLASGSRERVEAHPRAPFTLGVDWRF